MKAKPGIAALRRFALLRGVPAEDLRALLSASQIHRVEQGKRVRFEESRGGIFIVLSGSANALRCQAEQETFLFALNAGEFFGGPPLQSGVTDQSVVFCGQNSFDLLEIDWDDFISYLRCRPNLATLVLERALVATAEKFAMLSREYVHAARQAAIPDEIFQTLFPPLRPDCVRTEKEV